MAPLYQAEGVESNDPGDTGGETVLGLDQKDDAAWPGWVIVAQLKAANIPTTQWLKSAALVDAANTWYHDKYWAPSQADYLPEGLQMTYFGCAVNQGLKEAALCLQRALNVCGFSVPVDGDVGPSTLAAAAHAPVPALVSAFNWERVLVYLAVVDAHATDQEFFHGWINRLRKGL
ncbi:hypothetical protein KGP36_02525 [Patescibacteria group bacterium]|nr:hypothetical protein [Patescibacteria group bacterium]